MAAEAAGLRDKARKERQERKNTATDIGPAETAAGRIPVTGHSQTERKRQKERIRFFRMIFMARRRAVSFCFLES